MYVARNRRLNTNVMPPSVRLRVRLLAVQRLGACHTKDFLASGAQAKMAARDLTGGVGALAAGGTELRDADFAVEHLSL